MQKYNITLISALSSNYVIGKNNQLLWHLPKDFQWFKEQTKGFDIVMGKKTMDSIMTFTHGKPLPDRNNIVLSTSLKEQSGFTVVNDIDDILQLSLYKEMMIIGGEQIYKLFMPYAQKLILTEIHQDFEGDAFFPIFNKSDFNIIYQKNEIEKNLNFDFIIYQKK